MKTKKLSGVIESFCLACASNIELAIQIGCCFSNCSVVILSIERNGYAKVLAFTNDIQY